MYARIGRDHASHASTGRAFGYVFEDDIALHPSFAPAELGSVLHATNQALPLPLPLAAAAITHND